jgi:hypothetical protein
MMDHCGLAVDEAVIRAYTDRLKPPSYYQPDFSDSELATISEEAAVCAETFG